MTSKKSQRKNETLTVKDCTCFNLRKATRTLTQLFDDAMQPTGLRATQFNLVAAISSKGTIANGGMTGNPTSTGRQFHSPMVISTLSPW